MIDPILTARVREFAAWADALELRQTVDLLADALEGDADQARRTVEDAFARDLEFGTGGLRGIMGPGQGRINRVNIARATQGLADYILKAVGPGAGVVIAHDSRLRSDEFAKVAASVLAGNGLVAYLFPDLRPTPQLSFAVRHLKATAGIVVTASHNPQAYNGYKVSWNDGGQVLPPHDKGIIAAVRAVASPDQVHLADYDSAVDSGSIKILETDLDEAFLAALDTYRPAQVPTGTELRVVYTPLHGTGITLMPQALKRWGFNDVHIVAEQAEPDGTFPTAPSPNPEERAALALAIKLAGEVKADLVIATDPDADRVGLAVAHGGEFVLLTGNQTAALLTEWVCRSAPKTDAQNMVVETIVTTELVRQVAESHGAVVEECLTGFKYIAALMRDYEASGGKKKFLFGCEESYGYLVGDHCRDKDAIVAACAAAALAREAKAAGRTLVDELQELYSRHGIHVESQVSKTLPGMDGLRQMAALMESLRQDPPKELAGLAVATVTDLQNNSRLDLATGSNSAGPGLPTSDVLVIKLADGSTVVARPSGTEPKIKFYFMVVDREGFPTTDRAFMLERLAGCQTKDAGIREAFGKLVNDRLGSGK
jgi:phosphoglucomutase